MLISFSKHMFGIKMLIFFFFIPLSSHFGYQIYISLKFSKYPVDGKLKNANEHGKVNEMNRYTAQTYIHISTNMYISLNSIFRDFIF